MEQFGPAQRGAIRSSTTGNLTIDESTINGNSEFAGGGISSNDVVTLTQSTVGTDTITFDSAVFTTPQTMVLALGETVIGEAVTIIGPGHELLTIDVQQQLRIFNITATTGDFTIAGLTLTGRRTTGDNTSPSDTTYSGGAILSLTTANLTIDQSTISANSTTGILASGGVALTGSAVNGNSTAGSNAHGGGIRSYGGVTLAQSTVSGNSTAGFEAHGGGFIIPRKPPALPRDWQRLTVP